MTATLHKLSAGDGYTYLIRQVAAGDSTERGYSSLGDYYSARGEAPGTWAGAGLEALGTSGQVTEQQMLNLFGEGIHPDAERVRAEANAAGHGVAAAEAATRLGSPFPTFQPNQLWRDRISDAYAAYNTVHGNAVNKPIPVEQRERIRTDVAGAMFCETHDRPPANERELTSFVARASRPDRTSVAGYDVTFSPVKSVSTLWAVAPREVSERIEAAHAAAVADTIGWLERNAGYTRLGAHGIAQVDVHGLIAAAFTHRDSRAGDPDLHTHVAISNKVQTLDGRWLALDGRMIHRYLVAASEHYNTRLEAEFIARVGGQFTARETAPGKRPIRELDGVDPSLNERFSSRRRDITTHRAELVEAFRGRHSRLPTTVEMIALSQQANLATRQAKHEPRSLAEQREQWREQAIEVLGSSTALGSMVGDVVAQQTPAPAELTPGDVAGIAADTVRALQDSRAQWSRHNVLAEALRQLRYAGHAVGAGTDQLAEQVAAVALGPEHSIPIGIEPEPAGVQTPQPLTRLDGTSVYRMAGGQLYTSPAVLDAEQAVVTAAGQDGGRRVEQADVQLGMLEWSANNDGRTLNTSQAALVQQVATSDRRLQLVLAPAGTGKTTAMGALAAVWQGTGGNLIALAPQASAAQELAAQIPGVSSDTVHKLVYDQHLGLSGADPERWRREVTADSLIIVDEAGLASTPNLAEVTRFAAERGARVLLVGDDRQRAAAGAGGVLRDIEAIHGSLSLDEVLRFRDARQGQASLAMRTGDRGAVGYYVDRDLLHSVTPDQAADQVFAAWQADRRAGIASIMIAPTLDQVTELNLLARTARLGAATDPTGRELDLPNGEAVSAGDTIITKRNSRRLPLGRRDHVRNNYRWVVDRINPDGSITATEITRGRLRTLPAKYVTDGFVRLGYAASTAGVQGLTVDGNAYSLIDPGMTRNDLYPASTRAKGDNHIYLITGGVGDLHEVITPEAIRPQTAAEMFAAIIERDGADRSAHTEIREAADPHTRLTLAAGAYQHAVLAGAEYLVGQAALDQLTERAEQAVPGISTAHAWPALREHLAVLHLQGRDPIADLGAAAAARELGSARDLAATLDWRLDATGNHSLGAGPLPWLPAIPAQLAAEPTWGAYLTARHQLVDQLADQIRLDVQDWTPATAPAWAVPYLPDRELTAELALWRASTAVAVTDLRPAGGRPLRIAHQRLHRGLTARAAVVAGDPADGTGRWHQVLVAARAEQVTTDPYWPVLVARLTAADTAGAAVAHLIGAALAEKPLPSEAPAAVLWARIAPHVGTPTSAVTSHLLRPAWATDLAAELGEEAAERIIADRLWPTIVTYIDAAARTGMQPDQVIHSAARMLAAVADTAPAYQHPALLLTDVVTLTDPEPIDPDTVPADPDDMDLVAPADAFTLGADGPAVAADGEVPLPDEPADVEPAPEQLTGPAAEASRERLLEVLAAADSYYRGQTTGSWVPDYLAGRGLGALTGRAGLAPDGWTSTVEHLRAGGYADHELLAAGIARTSSRGTLIDAFRDRVMLPIHNSDGQVVGFTGRRNPATVDEYNPKYLNSPTTAVYSKTELPYGLHPRAMDALRAGADLAIAEGPMDAEAINLSTGGRVVAIASLGTALTGGQLGTLNQVAPLADRRVLTVMDSDEAGRTAAVRAFHLLADAGVPDPQTVTLPAGRKDPAETLHADGPDRLAAALDQDTHPLADLVVDDVLDRWPAPTTPEYRIGALDEVAPTVAALPAHRREEQIRRVAGRLNLDEHTVTGAIIDHLPVAPSAADSPLGLPTPPTLTSAPDNTAHPPQPYAEVSTEELRDRAAARAAMVADLQARQADAAQRGRALADQPTVRRTQQHHQDVMARAEHIRTLRADMTRLQELRQNTSSRAVAIGQTELRLDRGGRRAARRETDQLAQLHQQQETDRAEMYARGARVQQLQPAAGPPEQQDRILAEAHEIAASGAATLRAAAEHDAAQLARHHTDALALEETVTTSQADLDTLRGALDQRPDRDVDLGRDLDEPAPVGRHGSRDIGERGRGHDVDLDTGPATNPDPNRDLDLDLDIER